LNIKYLVKDKGVNQFLIAIKIKHQ